MSTFNEDRDIIIEGEAMLVEGSALVLSFGDHELWRYDIDENTSATAEITNDAFTSATSETAAVNSSLVVDADLSSSSGGHREKENDEQDDEKDDSDYSSSSNDDDDDDDDDTSLQNTQSSTTSSVQAANKNCKGPPTVITFYIVSDPKDDNCVKAGYTTNENNKFTQKRYKANGVNPVSTYVKITMASPNAQKSYDRKFREMMKDYVYVPISKYKLDILFIARKI